MPENEIFTEQDYREVYPPGIERHFWNRARNELVWRYLRPEVKAGELVVDVGCGNGIVVGALHARGINIRGVELGKAPVLPGLESRVRTGTDLFELDRATRLNTRAILLLDVLEHMGERTAFLNRISRELPRCDSLIITVPARRELWSDYDRHWGHYLRYDRPGIERDLEGSGFSACRTAYFFHWLYLVSATMRLTGMRKSTEFHPIHEGSPAAALHTVLTWYSNIENRLVPGFVAGSSILCVARRDRGTAPPT